MGIVAQEQDRIWLPFITLESTQRLNPHGVGLGLTLCKIICENYGGDISVYSDGSNGTTFEFRFKTKYSYQGQDREESLIKPKDSDLFKSLGISDRNVET